MPPPAASEAPDVSPPRWQIPTGESDDQLSWRAPSNVEMQKHASALSQRRKVSSAV